MMYHIAIKDPTDTSIMIRAACPQDIEALRRLAQRDSSAVPEGPLLIALVDGEARAASSLADGETIADPFHRTEEVVGMLHLHSSQLRETSQGRRGLKRFFGSRAGSRAPQPAGACAVVSDARMTL